MRDHFHDLFAPGLGKLVGDHAQNLVKPDAKFRFHKSRPVDLEIRLKIEADLDRLKLGLIEPVQTVVCGSTPVVPVLKSNGTVRYCSDFKVTVNLYADMQRYPVPHLEELQATLFGGKLFMRVELADAFTSDCGRPGV